VDASTLSRNPKTFVLVDPTSPDGETALRLLDELDSHVAVVLLLTGRMSAALKEFAAGEETDLASAGWIYLDQVTARMAAAGRAVEMVLAKGPRPELEIAHLAAVSDTRRVLVPSSFERLDPAAYRRLLEVVDVPVEAPAMESIA
jgi:hypothetical protein